jgi:hypothetical protein
MTIRTALGVLYEARSRDGGATWADLAPTTLPAPAAPSTVVREPGGNDLWLFWCNNAKAKWKDRTPQVFARSSDNGRTWSEPRAIEHAPKHGYGYISFTRVKDHALLTYYDWQDNGQGGFHMTSLRQRLIPLAWFRGEAVPPVFRKGDGGADAGRIGDDIMRALHLASHGTDAEVAVPDFDDEESIGTAYGGMHVFRRRGFYLAILQSLYAASGAVRAEWAWSHTGHNWTRTHTPCSAPGDAGAPVAFGYITETSDELVWLQGCGGTITRATLPFQELDAWLATLPQP